MESTQEVKCLLCGAKTEMRYKNYPGYQEPLTYDIYYCVHCNSAFSMPIVSDTQIIYDNIYRHGSSVPAYKRYWKYAEEVKHQKNPLDFLADSEASYWGVREALRGIKKEKSTVKILEAGSGLGYLTYALNQDGYQSFGLDISETSVEQAKKNYGQYYFHGDLFEYAEKSETKFDVVLATEVIEHLDEPVVFINALLKLLKPGGQLFLTTPNKSFFPDDIIWATENPPVHCWWFSEESMNCIAGKLSVPNRFVDLSHFYTHHYQSVDLKRIRKDFPQNPTLGKDGEVYTGNVATTSTFGSLRKFLSSSQPQLYKILTDIKIAYLKLKNAGNSDILVCKSRGVVLCAVFSNPN